MVIFHHLFIHMVWFSSWLNEWWNMKWEHMVLLKHMRFTFSPWDFQTVCLIMMKKLISYVHSNNTICWAMIFFMMETNIHMFLGGGFWKSWLVDKSLRRSVVKKSSWVFTCLHFFGKLIMSIVNCGVVAMLDSQRATSLRFPCVFFS